MTEKEFKNLAHNDTVEDKDGILGRVKSVDHSQGIIWVKFENELDVLWVDYTEVEKY